MIKKARTLRHKFIQEEGMKGHEKDMQNFFGLIAKHVKSQKARIGKPQLGILWLRDSLSFKRLC